MHTLKINNLSSNLKSQEKEQSKPKASRRKKIKTRAQSNETKKIKNNRENIFFQKINKTEKILARVTKERENAYLTNISVTVWI
jgi:hypothetical protein